MPISFQCPGCAKPFNVTDNWGGRPCRCECGTNLVVPFPQPATAISFQCPTCHRPYQLGPEWAGKSSRCGCGTIVTVPAPPPLVAAPLITDLLDEALAPRKPAPVQPWEQSAPPAAGVPPHPGAPPGYGTQHAAYAPSAASYGAYEQPRASRRGRGEMPSFVQKTIIGLYGASGLAVIYSTIPIIAIMSSTQGLSGLDATNIVLIILFYGWQLITFICGITCGQLIAHRSSLAVPICSLCGVWFIFSVFPLGWLFALVLWISLFASRDMNEWLAGR
jgi:hypothetical protein